MPATVGVVAPVFALSSRGIAPYAAPLTFAAMGIAAWLNAAVGGRRLHDRGKSAWWLLLFYAMPVALPYVVVGLPDPSLRDEALSPAIVGSFAVMLWGVIELGLLGGHAGGNRFGPEPGATRAADAFD